MEFKDTALYCAIKEAMKVWRGMNKYSFSLILPIFCALLVICVVFAVVIDFFTAIKNMIEI